MKNRIDIVNEQEKYPYSLGVQVLIQRAVKAALRYENFSRRYEVSVTLVDNEAIHRINLEHRGVDRPTDVLSFPMFDEDFGDGEACVLGDIVLSLERAYSQAAEYGHSVKREIAFLTVHSVLHLLGYDHEEGKAEESDMFARQEAILEKMGLSRK